MKKLCIFAALIASAFSDVGDISRNFEGYVYPVPPVPPHLDEPPVYLPPIFSDELLPQNPPPNNYLPPAFPPLDDTVVIPALPPPQSGYLPPTNSQLRIENMSCSQGLSFKATFKMQNDLPQYPVVDEAAEGCIASLGSNKFKLELDFGNMLKCGVKRCKSGENNNMCVAVRLPLVRGVRLPEDQVVTLMCTPQERVASQTKHVKLGSNRIQQVSRARSNGGFVATGGTRKDLKTRIGIFRKRPGSGGFEESVLTDTVIQLGEELVMRSVVNEGDGWKSSLVGPVLISGLISKKSVLLVDQQGCLNPAMKNICPKQPLKTGPLSTEMHFRAFLFQEAPQGDEMVVSVRTQGCIHPQDCIRADSCPDDGQTARSKREIFKENNETDVENWDLVFRVEPIRGKQKSAGHYHQSRNYLNYLCVAVAGLILSVLFIVFLLIRGFRR